jgi:RNA polymerase sigma factor (TIGR02999 family)
MSDVTQILSTIEGGDAQAAERLLPLVYEELRKLAAQNMAQESPDHTLQPTALVHEAYIRLVGSDDSANGQHWDGRGHFFAAAAEAMRRILVEASRKKDAAKRGGNLQRVPLDPNDVAELTNLEDVLAINEALEKLSQHDARAAELVKLRYFAGLPTESAGEILQLSRSAAYEQWAYAKAWLRRELQTEESADN